MEEDKEGIIREEVKEDTVVIIREEDTEGAKNNIIERINQ